MITTWSTIMQSLTVLLIPWFVISSSFSYNWRQKYVRQKNIRRCQDAKKALFHYFNEYNVPINTPLPRHNSPGHTELDLIISRFGFKQITWLFTFSPGFHYITLVSYHFSLLWLIHSYLFHALWILIYPLSLFRIHYHLSFCLHA